MSLTDDWEDKKLKWHKSYYCKNKKGEIVVATLMGEDELYSAELGGTLKQGYWEVLDICDYEELQELKHFDGKNVCAENEVLMLEVAKIEETNADLIETNGSLSRQVKHLLDLQANQDKEVESLRDLLKECKFYVEKDFECIRANGWGKEGVFNDLYELLTRINTAIGESEE